MCPFITPDFSEMLKPQGVPTGLYQARIISGEHTTSKKSGAPMIKWTFELYGSEGELEATNGMKVNAWSMLSGPASGKLRDLYRVAMDADMPSAGFDTDDLLGREVALVIEARHDDNGEIGRFPDVKGFRRAGIPF